jgi:hypothetical protein
LRFWSATKAKPKRFCWQSVLVCPLQSQSGPSSRIPTPSLRLSWNKDSLKSDSETREEKGGPKELWLLRKVEIEETIDRLKAGQSVDPKEIDMILKGQVQ